MISTIRFSKDKLAGVFYLGTILAGAIDLMLVNGEGVTNTLVTLCYIGVTFLLYAIFKPVNRNLSLIAALFSLAGCVVGVLRPYPISPYFVPHSLAFFGIYCILIGYLIFKSTFLPHALGVLMVAGGLGWLTFISPPLTHILSPYNLALGILGQAALTLWLLLKGVNVEQWRGSAVEPV